MMRKLAADELEPTPWKNGGGATVQLAAGPPGATVDKFEWRVSRATMAASGPFSSFPGVDRTLVVIEGGPLRLSVAQAGEGGEPERVIELDRHSEPWRFRGELAIRGEVVGREDVTDFNVMTRRGCWSHRLQQVTLHGPTEMSAAHLVVYCAEGHLQVRDLHSDATATLHVNEAAVANGGGGGRAARLRLDAGRDSPARVYVALIDAAERIDG